MRRVVVRGLLARPIRTVLSALAVVLGVAMVSGTYVLTDTISHAFDTIFTSSYKNTSAVIAGRQVVKDASSGNATIPQTLLPRVRAVRDVDQAAGAIFSLEGESDQAKLLDSHGKSIGDPNSPNFAFGFDAQGQRFNPLSLTKGHWASGPNEVVIDKGTAADKGYGVGDRIGVSAPDT